MFRHLRNRLILINLAVTSLVLILSFSSVYIVAQEATQARRGRNGAPIDIQIRDEYGQIMVQTIHERIESERQDALRSLLRSLIIVGIVEEIAVAILSYVLAEAAIRPIHEAYEAQRTFIANASHEIKTPIAAIMANLEVADIQGNQWIDNVSQEVNTLATLNQQLLTLARADQAMTSTKAPETVVLREYVEGLVEPFRPRLKQQRIHFSLHTKLKDGKAKLITGDFSQIFGILMDNAIKYGQHQITLHLTSHSLTLANDGATIAARDLPHIFERFYQTDKSSEGVGLGLAIAKSLADHNGWKLSASSDEETTKFTLEF